MAEEEVPAQGRIVVIDDETAARTLYAEVLRAGGYSVIEGGSLMTARRLLAGSDRHPDTQIIGLVLDNRLPDGLGVELVAELRADDRFETLPVLVVTGDEETADEIAALDAGSTDFLLKPVDPDVFLARVNAHLRKRASWLVWHDRARSERDDDDPVVQRLAEIVDAHEFHTVFQPIVELAEGVVRGYEALTRFDDGSSPSQAFDAVASSDVAGTHVEIETLRAALHAADLLPDETYVCLNVSPRLLTDPEGRLGAALRETARPVVLEITERQPIDDYPAVVASIAALDPSIRISVDDAGAGHATLRHVLKLRPDFVKLDRDWVRGIERDLSRQALVAGLVHFSRTTGCGLVAEGVETAAELELLRELGVDLAQGFYLGRPAAAGPPPSRSSQTSC